MRKFIVSDLHGNGEVYDSIISYLENISLIEDIELYINGDLIDRGLDSYRMLEDVIERINNPGKLRINYLAGNHELLMYRALNPDPIVNFTDKESWSLNGGDLTISMLDSLDSEEEAKAKEQEFRNFLGKLEIYHEFEEKIGDNKLVLVHATAPKEINTPCTMHLSDDDSYVYRAVWLRKENRASGTFYPGKVISYNQIGKEGYFTIIGHTPVNDERGFSFDKEEKVLNIDGGCAPYACGNFQYDKVPLVEVRNDHLEILVFNHNNEIVEGYYQDNEDTINMSEKTLNERRIFISPSYANLGEISKERIKEYIR